MKLMTASCAAMLAVAPATVGFAQDTQYPDLGSIAKTAGSAGQSGAAAPSERSNNPETITGRSASSKEGVPQTSSPANKSPAPMRNAPGAGDKFYPDWNAVAKTIGPASANETTPRSWGVGPQPITGRSVSAPKGASAIKLPLRDPNAPTRSADLGG
jgi:hypothetical protein